MHRANTGRETEVKVHDNTKQILFNNSSFNVINIYSSLELKCVAKLIKTVWEMFACLVKVRK